MMRPLNLGTGDSLRKKLAAVVCSGAWLDAVVPRISGVVRYYHDGIYPPGGAHSTMRRCRDCRRISPPHGNLPICCDCEVEQAELAFQERWSRASVADRQQLLCRWWREPIRFNGQASGDDESAERTPPSVLANPASVIRGLLRTPVADAWDEDLAGDHFTEATDDLGYSHRECRSDRHNSLEIACHRLGVPRYQIRFYDPIPRSSLTQLPVKVATSLCQVAEALGGQIARTVRPATMAFRRVGRALGQCSVHRRRGAIALRTGGAEYCLIRYEGVHPTRNVSINSGRSAGCELTLLSEREEALHQEISHFQRYGRLAPSVRRFSRPNPYRPAPEDHLDVLSCFGARRPRRPARRPAVVGQ